MAAAVSAWPELAAVSARLGFGSGGLALPALTRADLRVLRRSGWRLMWPVGTALLPAAITPKAGGLSEFWCELSAPRTLKLNEWATVTVQYGKCTFRGAAASGG